MIALAIYLIATFAVASAVGQRFRNRELADENRELRRENRRVAAAYERLLNGIGTVRVVAENDSDAATLLLADVVNEGRRG